MSYLARVFGEYIADISTRLWNGELHSRDLPSSRATVGRVTNERHIEVIEDDDDDDDESNVEHDSVAVEDDNSDDNENIASPTSLSISACPFVCRSEGGKIGISVSPAHFTNHQYMSVDRRGMGHAACDMLMVANARRELLTKIAFDGNGDFMGKTALEHKRIVIIDEDIEPLKRPFEMCILVVLPNVSIVRARSCYILVLQRHKKPLRINARSCFVEAEDAHLMFMKNCSNVYYYARDCSTGIVTNAFSKSEKRSIAGVGASIDGTRILNNVRTRDQRHYFKRHYLGAEVEMDIPHPNSYY